MLTIEGVGGVETTLETKLYNVPVYFKKKKGRQRFVTFQCYGLEQIACSAAQPEENSYNELCGKFGIRSSDVQRPAEIDILISMRRNRFHPSSSH